MGGGGGGPFFLVYFGSALLPYLVTWAPAGPRNNGRTEQVVNPVTP